MNGCELSNGVALLYLSIAIIVLAFLMAADLVHELRQWLRRRAARLRMEEYVARTRMLAEAVRKGGAI